jgi:hypothetical protein
MVVGSVGCGPGYWRQFASPRTGPYFLPGLHGACVLARV